MVGPFFGRQFVRTALTSSTTGIEIKRFKFSDVQLSDGYCIIEETFADLNLKTHMSRVLFWSRIISNTSRF